MGVDTTVSFEQGEANLAALVDYYLKNLGNRNEATTRSQLIDTLLYECLGWAKHSVYCEEPRSEEYADYTFYAPRKIMILEAKREGTFFEIPAGKVAQTYSIKSLTKGNPGLREAIEQVADYCQKRGVPLACCCNGYQLVAFVANRNDSVAPLDGQCVVYPSLSFMLEHFIQLWNLLSRPGIEDKNLERKLLGDSRPHVPPTLATTLGEAYPGTIARNEFQTELQLLVEAVLEDIPESAHYKERFIRECYCTSGALSQHSLANKVILRSRYAAIFTSEQPGPSTAAASTKGKHAPDLFEALSRRPILLLGDVGVGKTMFLSHLVDIDAPDTIADSIVFYINLGTQGILAVDLAPFVVSEIEQQLRDKFQTDIAEDGFVRNVYRRDLQRFEKSVHGPLKTASPEEYLRREIDFLAAKVGDQQAHLRASLEVIAKTKNKQILVFLDNCDQRDDRVQDAAFLIATEIAAHWPALVYLPLRPETFHRSRREGALSGYHPKAFFIAPPRTDRVIEKRLRFACDLVNEDAHDVLAGQSKVKKGELTSILESFVATMQRSDDIVECVDNISGGNMRLALGLVKGFFSSGHADMREVLQKHRPNDPYTVPLHHFLRAAIYGDTMHYDPASSPFANLFDLTGLDSREHFTMPLLLGVLKHGGLPQEETGFVDTGLIYGELQGIGFSPDQIDFALVRALRKHLVEAPARQGQSSKGDMARSFRITTIGEYHHVRLPRMFSYVDAVIVATPVADEEIRKRIQDVRAIKDRILRAEVFQKYLDACWNAMGSDVSHLFDWSACSAGLTENIEAITQRSQRLPSYGRHLPSPHN